MLKNIARIILVAFFAGITISLIAVGLQRYLDVRIPYGLVLGLVVGFIGAVGGSLNNAYKKTRRGEK